MKCTNRTANRRWAAATMALAIACLASAGAAVADPALGDSAVTLPDLAGARIESTPGD